jgi:hypothetical protein
VNFYPTYQALKTCPSTLIPLPIIEKALVEEETQVGTPENPKLEYEPRGSLQDSIQMESSKYNL